MRCPVCLFAPSSAGVLCSECRADLTEALVLAPEQVAGRVADPTRAALVDLWGRVHLLDPESTIGRDLGEGSGIAIHAPSVSRVHAKLVLDRGVWSVTDVGSSNGTFVEDARIDATTTIHAADRLRFGQVAFYFLDHVEDIPVNIIVDSDTVRPGTGAATLELPIEDPLVESWSEFQLHEPTGGGGGIVQIDGKQIQLTLAQLELVVVLTDRMEAETEKDPPDLRGFVSVPELLGKISLEVPLPRDAHVRQLIRRVRRAFIKAGLGDLIESRYGLGYRIRLLKARK
ncbi:MAG: FHA domain-containing protein [Deltaproteobacteria bacterium]|nr:FHA domain-containing protein [Deltaproteobacteria bacterium]